MEIKNLNINFGDKKIFENFNAYFADYQITCILGESGIGKTTLLNAIASTAPYSGQIEKNGDVSYIFQEDRLVPNLSVEKNLELVIRSKIKDSKKRKEIVNKVLKAIELEGEEKSIKKELSGGMAQRVSMARAFIYPSQILLLDEPFKGLDPSLKDRLIKILLSLYESDKRTIIFVTHAIDEALLLSDRIIVLGGSPANIIFDETVDAKKENRLLSDAKLDDIRKKLLDCRK